MSDYTVPAAAEINSVLDSAAREFIAANALAAPGDIVETTWHGWKRARKVRILDVGAHLVARFSGTPGQPGADWVAGFAMNYTAQRLRTDGSTAERHEHGGIFLINLVTADGRTWEQGGRWKEEFGLNHAGLSWGTSRDRRISLTTTPTG